MYKLGLLSGEILSYVFKEAYWEHFISSLCLDVLHFFLVMGKLKPYLFFEFVHLYMVMQVAVLIFIIFEFCIINSIATGFANVGHCIHYVLI